MRMIDKLGRVDQHTLRITDLTDGAGLRAAIVGDEVLGDEGEEAVWPGGVGALATRVELLARQPDALAIAQNRNLVAGDSLARKCRRMFDVVQQCDLIAIGAEEK